MLNTVRRVPSKRLAVDSVSAEEARATREIYRRINSAGYPSLRQIGCTLREGIATLTGDVPSFFLKQVAQELAKQVDHVQYVNNCLRVEKGNWAEHRAAL